MSTRTPGDSDLPVRRIDRILTFMALGLTVVSIVCFFAVIIASRIQGVDLTSLGWLLVRVLPLIALPAALLLILALLISTFVRRSRANRGR